MKPTIIFFGSFQDHSAHILQALHQSNQVEIIGVVTTPPKPAGRKGELKKTAVHLYAESADLPIFTPEKLNSNSLAQLSSSTLKPDLFVSAGYGQLLPLSWLQFPTVAALNIHFSLLPKYRGAMPAEWALLCGESQTGVTLMEMNTQLDGGNIISQTSLPITPDDTRETLYSKLYPLGAKLFLFTLPHYLQWRGGDNSTTRQLDNFHLFLPPKPQTKSPTPYARLLTKDDSFIPWALFSKAVSGDTIKPSELTPLLQQVITIHNPQSTIYDLLERSIRALTGFPGVWTTVNTSKGDKRMKILSAHLNHHQLVLDQVQLEGLNPTPFNQIKNQLL